MMILLAAQEGEWDELTMAVKQFQNTTMSLRYSAKPVVVAPHHLTLGGGCEMVLHCDRAVGAAETYIGLVEVGVGLIPGGGGTKEMAVRAAEMAESTPGSDHFEILKHNFELTAMGKVATSAVEAKNWGLMRRQDQGRIFPQSGRRDSNARPLDVRIPRAPEAQNRLARNG